MSDTTAKLSRRRFLKTAAGASALVALPHFIPAAALGKDGAVPPSEQIIVGGIGIGNRGGYDLGCFLRTARRPLRGRLRREGRAPRGGQAHGRRASTATTTAPPIATSASCWPGRTSTPC